MDKEIIELLPTPPSPTTTAFNESIDARPTKRREEYKKM
jgi:hypothetical protein